MTAEVENTWKEAKDQHYQGIILGYPSFGMVSLGWHLNMASQRSPIFANIGHHPVVGKPVDVARNEISWHAMTNKVGFVLFRDDDVHAPAEVISRLIRRLPLKEKTDPETANMIVGGVVYSKEEPPVPMIHKEGYTAGFEDWELNDLVDCDAIGMGCTMIPVGVLIKTLPYVKTWRCANRHCETRWEIERWEEGMCPDCGAMLFPDWFKTIRDFDDDGHTPALFTEDAYFCRMVKEAGMKVYADTGVQCRHERWDPDPQKVTHYYFHPGVGPVWERGGQILFYPDAGSDAHEIMRPKPSKNGPVKFNVGSGSVNKKGYVNIDSTAKCDFRCDARDLSPAVREYGQAQEINASHLLEHVFRGDIVRTVRSWLKSLEPGGLLKIEVPDGVWAAKNYIKHHESTEPANDFPDMIIMGAQRWPGDEHKTLISEKRMNEIIRACKNQIAEYKVWSVFPKNFNQRVIRARIKKKK